LASTSSDALALELLHCCLEGRPWDSGNLRNLIDDDCAALFRIVMEGLGDRFERTLSETAARILAEAIEYAVPGVSASGLLSHYARARVPRIAVGDPGVVFVLSRVTLGADVAVTSVLLNAARKRFPGARLVFAGPRKNWELFAAARIEHLEIPYSRHGSLAERLGGWGPLREALNVPGAIVIDPDSRLTQLGLLPVCPEESYFFFESRSYGRDGDDPLPRLAGRWAAEVFGVEGARAFIAPTAVPVVSSPRLACVSFGTGGNDAKRQPERFERDLLGLLLEAGYDVLVDKGGDAAEAERVERAVGGLGDRAAGRVRTWHGAFAPFAASIARAAFYAGYDSSGQHVAAACGVPLVTILAGEPCERFAARWAPSGPGPVEVVRASGLTAEDVLAGVRKAAARFGRG
jgi:ADP-heptose:LPS heptosyltransferase